ncbi:hypothetical protein B0H10DRAFT_2183478 [Mycena sp. CBHHK59/15]|nr:hypothetical protein B0H10DRAFT_2183478 [Mycena sp. CBHHK59/15]
MPWTSKTFSWRWDVAAAGFFLETKWSKMRQKSSEKQELRTVVGCQGTGNTIDQWKSAISHKSVTHWLREGGALYGKPTNAKPPTPVTQFGNCQILPLFVSRFLQTLGAYGNLRDDGMAATVVWHIFANSDAGSSAGNSSGHFWVHYDRNNGYVAFVPKIDSVPGYPAPLNSLGLSAEALRANRAVLKMRKGLLSYTSREFRDKWCFGI